MNTGDIKRIMESDRAVLQSASLAHRNRTGHKNIMVGGNFVECMECHAHAHLVAIGDRLCRHGRPSDSEQPKIIQAEEF
jgi:hypothetical protein